MIDQALRDKVRALKAEYAKYGQHTGTAYALRAARAVLRDEGERARFDALGGIIERVDYGAHWWDEGFSTRLDESEDAPVRVLIVPDDEARDLDFECCPDPSTGRPDTGARWTKCECVIYREPADVHDAADNAAICQYGQPCGHKCDEARRIDREGVYGICAQYRDADGAWARADECWGFVDDDWKDELASFIASALDGYDTVRAQEAAEAIALTGAAH